MKSFFRSILVFALAVFAVGGFPRDANAGDHGGNFIKGFVLGAAVTAPQTPWVPYGVPSWSSCPGVYSCYDYGSYGGWAPPAAGYSPSPYAAGWSAIIKPEVVYIPHQVYPSGSAVVTTQPMYLQPGEAERQEAEAASRQAEQARQLIELAMRAGDRAQVESGIALLREAASNAVAAATVARELAFHEARGPFAQAATSNAQQAQAAADRISQTLQQYALTTTGQGHTR